MYLSSTNPDELKIANIVPVYKKQSVNDKTNYRPISLLPIISKLFEKVPYGQLETVANEIFCGPKKGHSSQNTILNLLNNWKKLEPFLFNLFINDPMFFVNETEIFNFADDTTIYSSSLNYEESNQKLSNVTYVVLNWFRINIMVANPGKFQMFLGSSIYNSNITYLEENKHIKGSNELNFWESPLMINLHLQNINM